MTTLRPSWFDWPEIRMLADVFAEHKAALRFVGGCVRDSIINRPVADIDMATSLAPEQVMQIAQKGGIKTIPTGVQHGTVTAVINKKHIEITSLRRDTACDGRHAQVEFTDDWSADAQRRDFTMNALSLSFDGELFDYTDGITDAKAGHIRFIGDAAERIEEDYLRILRFFRFLSSYAKTPADEGALAACKLHRQGIEQLSGERIQQEMLKLLAAENPLPALELMQEAGVLDMVIPAHNIPCLEALLLVEKQTSKRANRLAALLETRCIEATSSRWKLSGKQRADIMLLHKKADDICADMPEGDQKKLLRKLGRDAFEQLILFVWAQRNGKKEGFLPLLQLAARWTIPQFPVSGADLMARGYTEGKSLGDKLAQLEDSWEASDYTLSKEALLSSN